MRFAAYSTIWVLLVLAACAAPVRDNPDRCSDDSDCASDEVCLLGACELAPTPPGDGDADGDGDGGPPDGGVEEVPDGGAVDGGSSPDSDGGGVGADGGGPDPDGGDGDAGEVCGEGLENGGNGDCVPVGTCSDGFAYFYVDVDGDGYGSGDPAPPCLATNKAHEGKSAVGGDCAPDAGAQFQSVHRFPELDGDGFTGDRATLCVGQLDGGALPGFLDASVPAPVVAAHATVATDTQSSWDDWENKGNAGLVDGALSVSDTEPETQTERTEILMLSGFEIDLPPGAAVVGIEVEVWRGVDPNRAAFDELVVLDTSAGQSDDRSSTEPWPDGEVGSIVYGGPDDLWGLDPTQVAFDETFAVHFQGRLPSQGDPSVSVAVDGVSVRLFLDVGPSDCDDTDDEVFAGARLWPDLDDDGFPNAAPDAGVDACFGAILPPGLLQSSAEPDCYDDNPAANPDQTDWFDVDRGDGSFDYDCDGTEEKDEVRNDLDCTCSIGCGADTSEMITPVEACGATTVVDDCTGAMTCFCDLDPVAVTVACR